MGLLESVHAGRHATAGGLVLAFGCVLLGGGAGSLAGKLAEALGFMLRWERAEKRRLVLLGGLVGGTIAGAACGVAAGAALGRGTPLVNLGLLGFFGLTAGSFLGSVPATPQLKKEGSTRARARLLAWHFLGAELETVLAGAGGAAVGTVYGALVALFGGAADQAELLARGLAGAGLGLIAGAVGALLGSRRGRFFSTLAGMILGIAAGAGLALLLERLGHPGGPLVSRAICGAFGGAAFGLIGAEWARDKRLD